MLAEPLDALRRDVRRLLAAGGLSAASDEGLRSRLALLRPLATRVPALAALIAAVERVTTSAPEHATTALLDLLALLRQVAAALAAPARLDGPLESLPECGPWATAAPIGELFALQVLDPRPVSRKPLDEIELLHRASERGIAADLRNVGVFLDLLAGPSSLTAGVLLVEVLPFFGRALLPDLRANLHRGMRFLVAMTRYDAEAAVSGATALLRSGRGLLPRLAELGSDAVRVWLEEVSQRPEHADAESSQQRAAALALQRAGQPGVRLLVELLQTPQRLAPYVVLAALAELGPLAGEAVSVLMGLLDSPSEEFRRSAIVALGRIGPPARPAIPALRQILNQWGEKDLQLLAMEALGDITRRPKENG